jgi:hypothetical protein
MDFINWFSGGKNQYMNMWQCMRQDRITISLVIALCLGIIAFYTAIAWIWWNNAKLLTTSPAKKALNSLKWVFVLCAFCGYAFPIMKLFWPAWRLEA